MNEELYQKSMKEIKKKQFHDSRGKPSISRLVQYALLKYFGIVKDELTGSSHSKRTTAEILEDTFED